MGAAYKMITNLYNQEPKGFTLIEVMIVLAIISVLFAISLPNYMTYRDKAYCSQVENDANIAAAAITDYFMISERTQFPVIDDLNISILNPLEFIGNPLTDFSIQVTDRTRRCPIEYQNANDDWENFVFTKKIR